MSETDTKTKEDRLLETILNEIDITFEDAAMRKKIERIKRSGEAYLEDKFGRKIDFEEDMIALDLLVSFCRYGRSNAIEQFTRDFAADLTAFAIRGAMLTQEEKEGQEGAAGS